MWARARAYACEVGMSKIIKSDDKAYPLPLATRRHIIPEEYARKGLWGKFWEPFGLLDCGFEVNQTPEGNQR